MDLKNRRDFAAWAGCDPATVSRAASRRLKPAVIVAGNLKMYDADHDAAKAFRRHYSGGTPPMPLAGMRNLNDLAEPPPGADVDFTPFMNLSLAQIVGQFGTDERFRNWLSAAKLLVEIHAKNLQTRDREKDSISRDLVRQHIFGSINDSNQRLLIDAPKTIARRVSALAISGGTHEEAEKIIREIFSQHLRAGQLAASAGLQAQVEQVR